MGSYCLLNHPQDMALCRNCFSKISDSENQIMKTLLSDCGALTQTSSLGLPDFLSSFLYWSGTSTINNEMTKKFNWLRNPLSSNSAEA